MAKKKFTIQQAMYLCATLISIVFVAFHVYTAGFRELIGIRQRLVHLTLGLMLAFIVAPLSKKKGPTWWDIPFILLVGGAGAYIFKNIDLIEYNFGNNSLPETIAGGILIVVLLEITRRLIGWPLPIIAMVALLYGFFGHLIPGAFGHAYIRPVRYIALLGLSTEGIFGSALAASASIVAMFIIFAALLNGTGAGQYFIDLVMGRFGRSRGGAAKSAVVGSALMGTLSGSVIANVVGTGTFTIPLMKENGYQPKVAGAVEAVSSTGGQIMPPVMGAAAYIICEILAVPFTTVMKAAIIPALLYYLAEFIFVDLYACKFGLLGMQAEEVKAYRERAKGKFYLILPLLLLIILLTFAKLLPQKAAFWAAILVFCIGILQKNNRLTPKKILEIVKSAARNSVEAIAACACAGIIVGTLSITGLGLHLSSILIDLAGGRLMVLLVLTMVVALILGMGLTTTASYIILAVLVAPTLITMGVEPIAAHMFVFYFGCYSAITPPVALGAYVAGSMAGAEPFKTGFQAWVIALPGFIVPFMFVYAPELLFIGSPLSILWVFCTACCGVWFMSIAIVGYFRKRLNYLSRAVILISGLLLIIPERVTDFVGIGVGVVFLLIFGGKRESKEAREARRIENARARAEAAAVEETAGTAKHSILSKMAQTVEAVDTLEGVHVGKVSDQDDNDTGAAPPEG